MARSRRVAGTDSENKGASAWLISWVPFDKEDDPSSQRVAAILDYRIGAERVRLVVNSLYQDRIYTVGEKLRYTRAPKTNPYPAEFEPIAGAGPWQGHIWCGHEPRLFARLVSNLRVSGAPPDETATWQELPRPEKWLAAETSRVLPNIEPATAIDQKHGNEIWGRIRASLDAAVERYNNTPAQPEPVTIQEGTGPWCVTYRKEAAQSCVVVDMSRRGYVVTCHREFGRGAEAGTRSWEQVRFEETTSGFIVMPPSENPVDLESHILGPLFSA
jgi:hypothetical protein